MVFVLTAVDPRCDIITIQTLEFGEIQQSSCVGRQTNTHDMCVFFMCRTNKVLLLAFIYFTYSLFNRIELTYHLYYCKEYMYCEHK